MSRDPKQVPTWIGDYRLDRAEQRLWRNGAAVDLVPQVWALLSCLVEHAGQLLTKDEILKAAWPGVAVSDMALSQAVRRLRTVLGDDARRPRYIETVHRRGFRWIATPRAEPPGPAGTPIATATPFVGRDLERRRLAELLNNAARTEARQVVFIEGEAGIGKTALVRSFLAEHADGRVRVAFAQCVEQQGSVEPYMPVLEALDRLARSSPEMVDVLRRYAPTWLVQTPWLLTREEAQGLENSVSEATRARMLREMGRALEIIAAERPLVLVIEDLHWADPATIDLLGSLARRPDAARLMVLGTYRPAEAIAYHHPIVGLVRSLWAGSICTRLVLGALDRAQVEAYLSRRFSRPKVAASLTDRIHAWSEGNPLFLVTMVEHLLQRGFIAEEGGEWHLAGSVGRHGPLDVPGSLREMIELQLTSLDPGDLELFRMASVAAVEFRSASVAAALDQPGPQGVEAVENACDRLIERGQLLRSVGEQTWPDGTRTTTYVFRHELYRRVLYEGIPWARKRRCHQRIGERLERAFVSDPRRIAAELVLHFSRSGDDERTVRYALLAAEQARACHAVREAAGFLSTALRHLDNLPESPDRDLAELQVRMHLLLAWTHQQLADADEDERNFCRIRTLAARPAAGRHPFPVQSNLSQIYHLRSLPGLAEPIARRLAALADPRVPSQRMEASLTTGVIHMMRGRFVRAAEDLAHALEVYGEEDPPACASFAGYEMRWRESGAVLYTQLGMAALFLGRPDTALVRLQRALQFCASGIGPYWAASVFSSVAGLFCLRGNLALAREASDHGLAIAEDHTIQHHIRIVRPQRIWLSLMEGKREGALDPIRSAWADYASVRRFLPAPIGPLFLLDACRAVGAADQGLRMADEVWQSTRASGVRWYDAELQRLNGELLVLRGRRDACAEAAACFQRSLQIAHAQGNRLYELRAATSLLRLSQGGRNAPAARAALQSIYEEFTEGFETADLRAAEQCLRGCAA